MINNIWYKGNTNKTSVIIFSKLKIKKLPAILICFGENLRGGFCDASCCSSFHFWSSFCCCIFISFLIFILLLFFICRCSLFCCCFSFTFSFRRHPSPFRGLLPSFYTHFILSAQPIAEWLVCDTFIFNHSVIFLPRALWPWVGIFYSQAFFTLCSFTDILICVYQGFTGSQQFFLEICRASYWFSKHRPGPSVCLVLSNPQSSYSKRFSFKFYHILAWIACGESLIYLLLTRFELLLLVQTHM